MLVLAGVCTSVFKHAFLYVASSAGPAGGAAHEADALTYALVCMCA